MPAISSMSSFLHISSRASTLMDGWGRSSQELHKGHRILMQLRCRGAGHTLAKSTGASALIILTSSSLFMICKRKLLSGKNSLYARLCCGPSHAEKERSKGAGMGAQLMGER